MMFLACSSYMQAVGSSHRCQNMAGLKSLLWELRTGQAAQVVESMRIMDGVLGEESGLLEYFSDSSVVVMLYRD